MHIKISARIVFFLMVILSTPLVAQISWTQVSSSIVNPPYFNQWHYARYDTLNNVTLLWVADNAGGRSSIYSDSLWVFNASTQTLSEIGTNNQPASGNCVTSSSTWPGSRHPVGQMFWDSKRNRLLSVEGVCGGINQMDMWYFQANQPLTNNVWTPMSPAHLPSPPHNLSSIVHDSDDDVYFLFGADIDGTPANNWLYCPTDLNPTPGVLTAAQTGAGCSVPDDWTLISVVGGVAQQPVGVWMPGLIYDSVHKTIIAFGGCNGNCSVEEPYTWSYSLATKTWTSLNPTGNPAVPGTIPQTFDSWSNAPNIAFNPNDGKIYYHQPTTPPVDWSYDYGTNTWTQLCQCGGSPTGSTMDYDASINGFVQWAYGGPGVAELWIGRLSGLAPTAITSVSPLTAGTEGSPYSFTLSATGPSPITWQLTSGTIPSGLSLSSSGILSGTPLQSGTFSFAVRATSASGTAGPATFSLTIAPAASAVAPSIVNASSVPGGTQNVAWSYTFTATGSTPISWDVPSGTIPPGLTLASNGTLSGVPSSTGSFSFTIRATNAGGVDTQQASVTISPQTVSGTINIPLTIQEAVYPGSVVGVARTNEPFCMGVPLADSANLTNVNNLTLTGVTAGQFRILGRWPSGNAKWVEACGIVSALAAGGTTSVVLANGGSGNFGGSNLASDMGTTIVVATGSATFTIRKANFNGIDQVVMGGTTVVASGTSQGFVVTGPNPSAAYPANVTCTPGTCTTAYSSAHDAASTCAIEKNGPVEAVLKCTFDHKDVSGAYTYMHGTARLYFYQGKTAVKVTSILRNADYGASNSFATAFKGHQGYELRIAPNLTGTANYAIANHTGSPSTGALQPADGVYLYQGESQLMKAADWCGYGCVTYTNDQGYSIVKNGSTVISGTDTQYPEGWADISGSNGAGVEIGVYQLAAYWPKSLEFNQGGTDVRIGIWARQNSQPYYQAWPQYSTHDLFLNFHSASLSSPEDEFLKFNTIWWGAHPLRSTTRLVYFPINSSVVPLKTPFTPRRKRMLIQIQFRRRQPAAFRTSAQ